VCPEGGEGGACYKKFAIPADSFARMIAFAIEQAEDVDVNEILLVSPDRTGIVTAM
jgi:NADP-dependent 3-hydroxy acid dehydrogenase YdfG